MKNPRFELHRRLARQYHRNSRGDHFDHGILVRHDYSEIKPDDLSWWDDVQFILGGRRVAIAWQHPRHVYQGMIEEAAMSAASHLRNSIDGGLFGDAGKNYRKVGRSRKKIVSYTTRSRPGESEWFDAVRAEEARLSKEAEFSVALSIKVESLPWCRFVEIVAPIEIRCVEGLRILADLVRRILNGQTTLESEFPGYLYGKQQWIADGLADQPSYVISHLIA